jgi:hypothetical protein
MKRTFSAGAFIFSLISWMAIGMLTSCSGSDDDTDKGKPEIINPLNDSTRTLLDIFDEKTYDPTELGDVIGNWPMLSFAGADISLVMKNRLKAVAASRLPQMDALFNERVGKAADGSRQWNVKRYVFTYKSISGITGNDTTLVGSVIFPTNTVGQPHQVDVLTLYHHQAYFMGSWLPSNAVTMMALHALHNSAVIEPDGQGWGDDNDKIFCDNMQGDLLAVQMADCVLAAIEVMGKAGVTLAEDGYTNNWGTSVGVMGATGFAQYMENDAPHELQQFLRLRATFIGEGPLMPSHIQGGEAAAQNPPFQKYYDGWNPCLPFYMSSSPQDGLVFYDEVKKYYEQLRPMPDGSVSDHVQWFDLNVNPSYATYLSPVAGSNSVHFLSSTAMLLIASIANNPEDVKLFLEDNHSYVGELYKIFFLTN